MQNRAAALRMGNRLLHQAPCRFECKVQMGLGLHDDHWSLNMIK